MFKFFANFRPEWQGYVPMMTMQGVDGRQYSLHFTTTPITSRSAIASLFEEAVEPERMHAFLQVMVNEAAKLGIVPHDHATTMEATKRHLEDMRALAFHKLGTTKPESR